MLALKQCEQVKWRKERGEKAKREKTSKWEMGEMKLPFQRCGLIGEQGDIIRWASPRCTFLCFSFSLAAPNFAHFFSASVGNSHASAGPGYGDEQGMDKMHPSAPPHRPRWDKSTSGQQSQAAGSVLLKCLCGWRTSGPDMSFGSSSASPHVKPLQDHHRMNCLLPYGQTVTVPGCTWVCCFFLCTTELQDGVETSNLLNPGLLLPAGGWEPQGCWGAQLCWSAGVAPCLLA